MDELSKAVAKIQASNKYKDLCEDTIRDVLTVEIGYQGTLKKAIGPARERLHKIWAEYLGMPLHQQAMQQLRSAFATGASEKVQAACLEILDTHLSSKERLELQDNGYYASIFEITGIPQSIADLACALHPLAFRWMGLPKTVAYHAYDINKNFVELIELYFELEGLQPLVEWRDISVKPPENHCDVAFLFKMYHCLEHRRKGAGLEMVKNIRADWTAVSFPSQNLIGKKADIYGNYAGALEKCALERNWELTVLDFSNETLVLIKK